MSEIFVSFDLETLHTRADGVILSIAAAARVDGSIVTFYSHCDITSQPDRFISEDTIAWWKTQGETWTKTCAACAEAPPLEQVLRDLNTWYASLGTDKDTLYPWGNGANFDIAFLEHAFNECGMKPAWQYWTTRDLRTLKDLAKRAGGYEPVTRYGVHHDARDDAITQLLEIENCMEVLYGCPAPALV
ncbi:3'-5' exonuclease [Halomonas sp. 707B3]|uniref:3'-5' exonuclease n=1 Tax=Halomonas sp. 707B3 TaxID=1681043 RepID=UPI0020A1D646|nr:3'-5' exonuclease [Halomonas sp. 707B3]MCP1316886.1 3'-5' exoribonuclease [Halomonas sp. 707B3]